MTSTGNRRLGRYELVRVLGKGAMGLVYEARDPNLERRVAIKTIKVENLSEEASTEYEARFRTEARSAARLQHPNIVSVYDSDRDGDVAYLVMEYVQGEDLKHHLGAGTRFSLEQSLGMVADLLSALEYAHRQNIVHRDVKPANLLIEASGRVKLADFGVARIQDAGDATRTKGSMVGTLKYMSPEQVQGQPVDARSDLFAAGVLLYQLLTGRRPFDGETDFAIIQQIVAIQPEAPSSINPQLPAELDAVMERALAKSREARFASAREFAIALQEATGQLVDRTMVPPAGPRGSSAGGGTGSRAPRSDTGSTTVRFGAGTGEEPGSTVTQELELVYWKDVRDSDEAQDLEGFLSRFPAGIYADLARRRLRKLAGRSNGTTGTGSGSGGNNDHEATRLDGSTLMLDPAARGDDPATLLLQREPGAATEDAAQADASVAGTGTGTGNATGAGTGADRGTFGGTGADAPEPASPATPVPEAAENTSLPAPTPAQNAPDVPSPPSVVATRSRRPLLVGAALAVVVLGILAYQRIAGDSVPAAEVAAALVPAIPASGAASAAGVATSAASGAGAMAAAQVTSAPASAPVAAASAAFAKAPSGASSGASFQAATKPVATASAAKNVAKGSGTAAGKSAGMETASTTSAPTMAPQQTPPAKPMAPEATAASNNRASASPGPAASPAQACADRVLLGYQICLNTQCALPAFTNHPICVERRAAEKALRDAQANGRN